MQKLHVLTFLLVVAGGINWLLLGVFQWEIGELFGGSSAAASRIIYTLVGAAAIYELAIHKGNCKACSATITQRKEGGNAIPDRASS